jgi:phenylacetate-CoA ligase
MIQDRESLRAFQLGRLRELLACIREGNAFYRDKLEGTGLFESVSDLREFINVCPFTTKEELATDQSEHPPYGRNLSFPLERYIRFHQTSATTGTPIRWLDTREDWEAMLENWRRVYQAAGVTAEDSVYFAFSFGPFIGFWTAFDAAAGMGCLCIPGGGMSSSARLRAILECRATVLCCTPTYALRLVEVAREEGINLKESAVRAIIVAGEPGGSVPSTRLLIEEGWPGAHLFDHHGMTEVGPVSYQRVGEPQDLRIMEEAFFAEVIDPKTEETVEEGCAGELVLTTLHRKGSPLLRYRTGDIVRVDFPPLAPGNPRDAILRGGILGRVDDMVLVRGVNVYPSAVENLVREFSEVVEYQVELKQISTLVELKLKVEPAAECANPDELIGEIRKRFRDHLNIRVDIQSSAPGSLPRFEMKARRWKWV